MSLSGLRDAIVSAIDTNVSGFKVVQTHGGKFNEKELRRWAFKAPACLVAAIGGPASTEAGEPAASVTFIAFIVVRGTSDQRRDEGVLFLVESVASLAVNNAWVYECAQGPRNVRVDNLYTGEIDKKGVALWSVSWSQRVNLTIINDGVEYDFEDLDDLNTFAADFDLAPADGQIDGSIWVYLHESGFMSTYAHLDVSSSAATSVPQADTYYKAAGTTNLAINSSDVDMPADNRLRYTGTTTKPMIVDASAAILLAAGSPATVTLAFAKNGVIETDSEMPQYVAQTADPENVTLKHVVSMSENDYIEVWLQCTSALGVTLQKLHVNMAAV